MQKYHGGCQCKAVRFEMSADITKGMTCNCSRCGKLGWVLMFVPAEQFTLQSDADNMTEYLFHEKKIVHLFCKTCGIESFARGKGPDGTETIAVNIRCLDGVDIKSIPIAEFNGKDI